MADINVTAYLDELRERLPYVPELEDAVDRLMEMVSGQIDQVLRSREEKGP